MICLQETRVTQRQFPGLAQRLRSRRWALGAVHASSWPIWSCSFSEGAALSFGDFFLLGDVGPVVGRKAVRRFSVPHIGLLLCDEAMTALATGLAQHKHRQWLLGTDFNASPFQGTFASFMQSIGGQVLACGGHVNSVEPIDSLWGSQGRSATEAQTLEPLFGTSL